MAKKCKVLDHTADAGLEAWADSPGELFEALGEGLCDLVCPRSSVTANQARTICVTAEDMEALAVDFLTEVLWLLQTDLMVIAQIRVTNISANQVAAEADVEPYDPARHEFLTEVKAVTYHQLYVRQQNTQWLARVILDL